ncbi:hypothetical protein EK21DRAFT_98394 [Setomelanomma holmii]|uniref:RING-type domain-containing protein n=1 Tax=Setomelanomma holmii TaxID=210430 RepID=A0A9P4HF10_9PLEO|nr:hypothetical protein EK21DRAFT_98394 [Setomelanomma holmii]
MAVNETETITPGKGGTVAIAVIVPVVFVIVLFLLILTALVLPRLGHGRDNFTIIKKERMKQRLVEINTIIKSQNFHDWLASQKEEGSKSSVPTDPICAICLDNFAEDARVRGLRCSHAFHASCLDEWFARFNEFCPLCHGTIIPGKRVAKKS